MERYGGAERRQRERALQVFDENLKDAISEIKRDEYRRELASVYDYVSLGAIENRIMADHQLTSEDRLQLFGEIECAMTSAA